MSSGPETHSARTTDPKLHPFRRAVLRGLALLLPPLLTIVIFLWVGKTITEYVLLPVEGASRRVIVWYIADIHPSRPAPVGDNPPPYVELSNGQFIPFEVYEAVKSNPGPDGMPTSPEGIYRRYVSIRYLKWYVVVPVFLCVLILVLYLLGKFLAAGVGRILWNWFDRVIHALPIIRNVYGSVKQVTDFVFSEREIEYTRVVAVEYPRKGIWSLGFVTGESFLDIRSAANEPVLSVLIPTSPMPATGFTVTIKKSEAIDLNITLDQAFQFCLSCGVVVPGHQQASEVGMKLAALAARSRNGSDRPAEGTAAPLPIAGPEKSAGDSKAADAAADDDE